MLGNRVWATFTFFTSVVVFFIKKIIICLIRLVGLAVMFHMLLMSTGVWITALRYV